MTRLVLDAGVWLAARDRDDPFHAEARQLVAGEGPLGALDLTLYEVANVATVCWGSRAEGRRMAELVVTATGPHLSRVDPDLIRAAIETSAAKGITVYDAAYVALAAREAGTLVSTDIRDLVRPGLAVSPGDVVEA